MVFILVEPQHSGNVGAAARAMKNMGIHNLTLVNPPAWDPETARWMAPGCDDFISRIRLVSTVEEALEDVSFAIASTARHRKQGHRVLEPTVFADEVFERGPSGATGVLFGREDFGLSTRDVNQCAALLRIPTPEHASLNLAQAVLLVGQALFEAGRSRGLVASGRTLGGSRGTRTTEWVSRPSHRDLPAMISEIDPAVTEILSLLQNVGYLRGTPAEKVALTARQGLQQAQISRRHVEAVRGMVSRIQWALESPGVDWEKTSKQ